MKDPLALPAVVLPTSRTKVFVNPDSARQAGTRGVIGENDRQVPYIRDHRVLTVAPALAETARMDVHVGHDRHVEVAAFLPHFAELSAIKLDNAVYEAGRVDVIVKKKLRNPPGVPVGSAQKKRAAFASSGGAAPELVDAFVPYCAAADQLWALPLSGAQQRLKKEDHANPQG